MGTGRKVFFLLGSVLIAFSLSGCYLNILQTAETLDRGQVLFGLGLGYSSTEVEPGDYLNVLTAQGQFGVGLADGVQLGLQGGILTALGGEGDFGFSGALGELKLRILDEPEAGAMALGIGGGWGFNYLGWGVHASLYLDSNIRVLPVYFVYRPFIPLDGEAPFGHHLAGGLRLRISETAALLLEIDYNLGLISFGAGFLFTY